MEIPSEEKLDPQQKEFLKPDENGQYRWDKQDIWIRGFPGSGKSIMLIYAIEKTLGKNKNARIVVITYTNSLVSDFIDGFRQKGLNVKVMTAKKFYGHPQKCDYIFCDEIQDLDLAFLQLMKKNVSCHLIVAGDENQSIYRQTIFGNTTILPVEIENNINDGFPLIYIHRLTRSLIAAINKMMPSLKIFEAKKNDSKKDVQIRICKAETEKQEVEYIIQTAKKICR